MKLKCNECCPSHYTQGQCPFKHSSNLLHPLPEVVMPPPIVNIVKPQSQTLNHQIPRAQPQRSVTQFKTRGDWSLSTPALVLFKLFSTFSQTFELLELLHKTTGVDSLKHFS